MPDRELSVSVDADDEAIIALIPGDDDDISLNDGELALDLGGEDDEGVNINSRYEWGDWGNPDGAPAFTIQNNDTQDYMFKMEYYFDDPDWITSNPDGVGNEQSFVEFKVAAPGGDSASRTFPDQRSGFNQDHSLPHPEGSGFGSNLGGFRFNAGEEYTMAVAVDTTGDLADMDDEPSGTLHITVADETSAESWDPRSPPN